MATDPDTSVTAAYDSQVRDAWIRRALSDGTRLDLGHSDKEQMFAVTLTGTKAVVATKRGWRKCEDGSEARVTVTAIASVIPNAGGHTHPLGRASDIRADMPGPEDGAMTYATGKSSYVISRRRAFAIDRDAHGQFAVRVIAGKPFGGSELAEIASQTRQWGQNKGGSGLRCEFRPD